MPAKYKEYAVKGKIVPIWNGTRMRAEPSTYTKVIASYNADSQVEIDLVREFTETVLSEYVWAGDKWGRVKTVNNLPIIQPAWMAIVYLKDAICKPDYVLADTPPVDPPAPGEKVKIISLTVVSHYADGSSKVEDFFPAV